MLRGKGYEIIKLIKTQPYTKAQRPDGISEKHPSTEEMLEKAAKILEPDNSKHGVATGQPFKLGIINALLVEMSDADADFTKNLEEALPLGVEEPTLSTPGIWPTKAELKGTLEDRDDHDWPHLEMLPPPKARENYDSIVEHAHTVTETYIEERTLGMTSGPHTHWRRQRLCADAKPRRYAQEQWVRESRRTRYVPYTMPRLQARTTG